VSGFLYKNVYQYYEETSRILSSYGYTVLNPLLGKGILVEEEELKSSGYEYSIIKDHAIFNRDRWMVKQSDIVFANLTEAKKVSIGTMMELAWAYDRGKHVVVCMQEDNIHSHAFVNGAAHIIFSEYNQAMDYFRELISKK